MVRWMRTARVSHGAKLVEAVTWAKEAAAFVEKKHNSPTVQVYLDAFGQAGTIRWIVDFENLASLETTHSEILKDPQYVQKLKEAESKNLFVPGYLDDVVMRLV